MWNLIVSSFQNLTPMLWAGQILGLIGFILSIFSYLVKKKNFLILISLAFVFIILDQAFAGLWAGMIVTITGITRNLIMLYFLIKYDKEAPTYIMYITLGAMIIAEGVYMGLTDSFGKWDNYLLPGLVIATTFTQNCRNEYVVKIGSTLYEAGALVYYIIYQLPFSIFREVCLVIACLVGIVLLAIKQHKEKSEVKKDIVPAH